MKPIRCTTLALLLLVTWGASADHHNASDKSGAEERTGEVTEEAVAPSGATTPQPATETASPTEPGRPRLPLNELRLFAQAFHRVSSAYVEDIDDKTLLENAIRGMLSELDPHSSYLDKQSFDDLQESTTGNYGGLGLEVDLEDGLIRVITPMDDTPADKAGIMAGDLIIQLDDQPVKGLSRTEAVKAMRGPPGSDIRITVVRDGEPPEELTLKREVIQVASVRHRLLEDGYGYIRIAQFQNRTGTEVAESLTGLQEKGKLFGLVLDLRNNPGGVLQSAVEVSDVFLDGGGLIVYTEGRMDNADLRYSATSADASNGLPLVVLVNEGTASASEIVAGALQDHNRAVIMGTNTFGKGSVQTILPLDNEKAIKLTTALYYTPDGRSIQASGIAPDIVVERSTVTRVAANPFRVKEKDLPKHLENAGNPSSAAETETGGADREVPIAVIATAEKPAHLAARDYQLNEALTLLKGLNILAQRSRVPDGG